MDFILWGRSNIHMTSHPLRDVTSNEVTWLLSPLKSLF